jgi:hypothetical protein
LAVLCALVLIFISFCKKQKNFLLSYGGARAESKLGEIALACAPPPLSAPWNVTFL